MIHHTRGVYPNGGFKDNGVPSEDLAGHIFYNISYRPGRAFFLDGICIHRGIGVSDELIVEHTDVEGKVKMDKATKPYV